MAKNKNKKTTTFLLDHNCWCTLWRWRSFYSSSYAENLSEEYFQGQPYAGYRIFRKACDEDADEAMGLENTQW